MGREGGGVDQGVGGALGKAAERAACDVDVGSGEVVGEFAQGEGDEGRLTPCQGGFVCGDDDGGRGGVDLALDGDRGHVVQLAAVLVEVACGVGEAFAGNEEGRAQGVGVGREGGGVDERVGGALREVAERAADDGDVRRREVAAGLAQGEGDEVGLARAYARFGVADHDRGGGRVCRGVGVAQQAHAERCRVVGVCAVFVEAACGVAESVVAHVDEGA